VPGKLLVEQRRIRTLDCDRQPLENERPCHQTNYLAAKVFKEMVCRVVLEPKLYMVIGKCYMA